MRSNIALVGAVFAWIFKNIVQK